MSADAPEKEQPDEATMTLTEHLAELRVRIIRAALAVAVGMVAIIAVKMAVKVPAEISFSSACRVAMNMSRTIAVPAATRTSEELARCVATMRMCKRRVLSLTFPKRFISASWPRNTLTTCWPTTASSVTCETLPIMSWIRWLILRKRRLMTVTSNPIIGTSSSITRVSWTLVLSITPSRKITSRTSRNADTTDVVAALATCSLL